MADVVDVFDHFERNAVAKGLYENEARLIFRFGGGELVIGGSPHFVQMLQDSLAGTTAYISLTLKREDR
jgi:hypothetical protein